MRRKAFIGVIAVALCVYTVFLVRPYIQPRADPLQKEFIKTKHAEARRLAQNDTNPIPAKVWAFFRAAERNDYESAVLIHDKLTESEYAPRPNRSGMEKFWDDFKLEVGIADKESKLSHLSLVASMWDAENALRLFRNADPKWIRRLGAELIATVSTNGILFTGTDTAQVTVLCVNNSLPNKKPIGLIAINDLADGRYLEYLRQTCGGNFSIPTPQDSQNAFQEYMWEAQRRMEQLSKTNGSSAAASTILHKSPVNQINSHIARRFMEKNPGREFFVGDVLYLDWLLPFLEPCGPLLRVRGSPVENLDEDVVQKDRDYWRRLVGELIGQWLEDKTPVPEVCRFVEATYQHKDLSRFKGAASFARDGKMRELLARLRASTATVYQYHSEHAVSPGEQQKLRAEADFAFRQALALCPSAPQLAESYADFLIAVHRETDARAVTRVLADSQSKSDSAKSD